MQKIALEINFPRAFSFYKKFLKKSIFTIDKINPMWYNEATNDRGAEKNLKKIYFHYWQIQNVALEWLHKKKQRQ